MRKDYNFEAELGRGSFGVVYRVKRFADGRSFVCKQIQLKGMSKKAREEANNEVSLLRSVSSGSDYIVQYVGCFLEGDFLHIIMEYCAHGDLSKFLKARTAGQLVEERVIWKFIIQISLGLRWLHHKRVLHRDIKTLNVFLTSADDVRLGDLGVARVLSHNTHFASTFVGTPYYLSPELCEEKPYNELSDVWAFGCVVYEMCALRHPFEAKNHAALIIKILRGVYAPISGTYSDDLRNLIDGCMQRDWTKRSRLADMLAGGPLTCWGERLGIPLTCAAAEPEQARAERGGGGASARSRGGPREGQPPRASGPREGQLLRQGAPALEGQQQPKAAPVKVVRQVAAAPAPVPARRAPDKASAPAPPRVRVRAGRSSSRGLPAGGVTAANFVAAPQIIRAPPARSAGRGQAAPGPGEVRTPTGGGRAGSGLQRQAIEEQRRAAREVADLPDFVRPVARADKVDRRNVPSVHQLLKLEADPSQVVEGAGTGSGFGDIAGDDATLKYGAGAYPPAASDDQTSTIEEGTLRPENAEWADEVTLLRRGGGGRPPRPAERYADAGGASGGASGGEVSEDLEEEQEGQAQPGDRELSLTHGSAFASRSLGDSLAYSEDNTCTSLQFTQTCRSLQQAVAAATDDSPPHSDAESGPQTDAIVPSWSIGGGEGRDDDADVDSCAEVNAKIDSDGLLYDVHWRPSPLQASHGENTEGSEEATEDSDDAAPIEVAVRTQIETFAAAPQPVQHAVLQAQHDLTTPRRPRSDPIVQLARIGSQISRLYAEIAGDLDGPAQEVWQELYQLFQSKMGADLSDEDQSEVERYVFERLPTNRSDLIWKVYKVLHLEQERDRWQKLNEDL